uniref:Uncharacterized protein n=1 Tax=Timspurckia oligopyrenoides TaxID=708627 RepID=A0A7S0ZBZ9_9RHOD|mmetsp:Transcript_11871/g.21480  ORF Transcript_11871/g.21480 Transcript_11871/m.21480 type:complete len:330 (+) Transcript_11871:177-1166(+)
MDEQVVPDWGSTVAQVPELGVTSSSLSCDGLGKSIGRKRKVDDVIPSIGEASWSLDVRGKQESVERQQRGFKEVVRNDQLVPGVVEETEKSLQTPSLMSSFYDHPNNEIRKKPRWDTPRRSGVRKEPWECAKEIGANPVNPLEARITSAAVREVLSSVIVMSVGLGKPTVDKWLQLLTEFLEMNVDEHLILLCLVKKYLSAGNSLRSELEFQRPQKWECVFGIGCYFSVLLSEEFAGRTAVDLRDLLGGNFKFGREQVSFLRAVDWRVNVDESEFNDARQLVCDLVQSKGASCESIISWLTPTSTKKFVEKPAEFDEMSNDVNVVPSLI